MATTTHRRSELPNYDDKTSGAAAHDVYDEEIHDNVDGLHRRLGNRQIQLIAIGGTIGTGLFVSIGGALHTAGPGSLFIAYTLYAVMLACVNNGLSEITTAYPVAGGFVRHAGHFCDEALGFTAGWNFFFYEALLIPFEITALALVLNFWRDDIPAAAVIAVTIFLYAILNVLAVKIFGEAEFWLSGGKVLLIAILFSFTFITMVGGNPTHDAYGFRYWNNPGAFAVHRTTGALGRFEGFLSGLWSASFTVVGPEYISMVAAEAKRPRIYIKNAFKTVYLRFGIFFIGGALFVGIILPYDDKTLTGIANGTAGGSGTAAASPYVIAMTNMGISVLPHIVNALLVTSIFSAGNTYTYCATRSLYSLALEGRAPKFLRKTTRNGVPIWCFLITMIFPFLSFLQLSNASSKVLGWLLNLVTAGGVIDYIIMSLTYIAFHRACKAQGLDRHTLPYRGWLQPYCGYIGLGWMTFIVFTYGYSSFKPWDVTSFFTYYTMLIVAPILFVGWKLIHKTKWLKPHEVDLVWERPAIDAYEATFYEKPLGFWIEMLQLVGFYRHVNGEQRRAVGHVDRDSSKEEVKAA